MTGKSWLNLRNFAIRWCSRELACFCIFIAVALSGSGFLPSLSIIGPRYLISSKKNSHFSSLTLKPNSCIRENNLRKCSRCCSLELLMIIISSRYAIAKSRPSNTLPLAKWPAWPWSRKVTFRIWINLCGCLYKATLSYFPWQESEDMHNSYRPWRRSFLHLALWRPLHG